MNYKIGVTEFGEDSFFAEIEAASQEEALEVARLRYLNELSFHVIQELSGLTKRIRILNLHKSDAFFKDKNRIIGKVFEVSIENFKDIRRSINGYFCVDIDGKYSFFACKYEVIQ